jgi:signal transduction histidine kinase
MHVLPLKPPAAAARPRDYAIALAATLGGLVLRYLLNPILGHQGPYLILMFPIVLAALYGGFGPALLATLLGTLIGTYLFISHGAGFQEVLKPANFTRTVLFMVIGLGIAAIGGRLRASRHALGQTVQQLRASNRAKDNAMATLGHEIRNPLSALLTAQQLLKRFPENPKHVKQASEVIHRQVSHLTRMADDLQHLSSMMQGEVLDAPRLVDLHQVLTQALEQSAALIAKKGHQLHTELSAQPVQVLGDETRLVQVFANLLNNAAKYTDTGGKLTLRLHTVDKGRVSVSVHDNGDGMQPESIANLFEPFVRAPGAANNAEGGLGLGLAIVKKIVQSHGGEVSAHSEGLGLGSTVTIGLPVALSTA